MPELSSQILYSLNLVTFLFYLTGYHLRHSHLWLSYGPVLSRVLISPAQHQIHHSVAKKHWDKNYGFIFAFWDGLFGSLYVPKEKEEITFGVGSADSKDYSSVFKIYFTPIKKILNLNNRR